MMSAEDDDIMVRVAEFIDIAGGIGKFIKHSGDPIKILEESIEAVGGPEKALEKTIEAVGGPEKALELLEQIQSKLKAKK